MKRVLVVVVVVVVVVLVGVVVVVGGEGREWKLVMVGERMMPAPLAGRA